MTTADGVVSDLQANEVTELSMALLATGFGYGADRRKVQGTLIGQILPQVRDIQNEEFEKMLAGQQTAKQALDNAVKRGNAAVKQAIGQ